MADDRMRGLAAIVLAAGYSSRMGALKPLLPLAGRSALEHAIGLFRDAGVAEIIVVLGNRADELGPLAESCGARCVVNEEFHSGMYTSVRKGAKALSEQVRGAFVLPADVPLVRQATIEHLAVGFTGTTGSIVYPVFEGRRGHPPLIARTILNRALWHDGPLSALLSLHESNALEISAIDEAIHMDMDTPADYEALCALASRRDLPSEQECEELLALRRAPAHLLRHMQQVSAVAGLIANLLKTAGHTMDVELVRTAALVHDLAKGMLEHAEAGAAVLREAGFPRVADVVAAHHKLAFDGTLDERAVVYLADKLVLGDQIVTLQQRFRPALERFACDPEALSAALKRKSAALRVAFAVEMELRLPLSVVLDQVGRIPFVPIAPELPPEANHP